MKLIPLTQGQFSLVDDEDYERVNAHKWYAAKKRNYFYAQREQNGACIKMHRFIMNVTDKSIHIDHRFGNGLDNRKENLRICTSAQNSMNRDGMPKSSSPYKGVSWCKNTNKWKSQIRKDNKLFYLGVYSDPVEAAKMYDKHAKILFCEFARLNFPND